MGLFGKGKTPIVAKFHGTDLVICSHFREGKPHLIAEEIRYYFSGGGVDGVDGVIFCQV